MVPLFLTKNANAPDVPQPPRPIVAAGPSETPLILSVAAPKPRLISDPADFRHYRKQLEGLLQAAEACRREIETIRNLPFFERWLCVWNLYQEQREMTYLRRRALRLHQQLAAYNEQSGLARSLPALPIDWQIDFYTR
jgi:hypothetical protein